MSDLVKRLREEAERSVFMDHPESERAALIREAAKHIEAYQDIQAKLRGERDAARDELARIQKERDDALSQLRGVSEHWGEFGPESGFDELIDGIAKWVAAVRERGELGQ